MQQQSLFTSTPRRIPAGRVRKGLDQDVQRARDEDRELPEAGVASLRGLADQLDQLERLLRDPEAKPYDRVPLAQLQRQFDDTYARTFGTGDTGATNPLLEALERFRAAEARDAQDTGPAD